MSGTYLLPAAWFVYDQDTHELIGHVAVDGTEAVAHATRKGH